jgi:uncharacterized membrane protein
MSLSSDARDKIQPSRRIREPLHVLALAILILQIVIAIGAFPFLPPVVPTHWDAAGHINGYAPKLVGTIMFPALGLMFYLLMRFVSGVGPRLGGRSNGYANAQVRTTLLVALLLFGLVVQLCATSIALGMAVDFTFVMNLALSLLFLVIGNFMGKTRRNFWVGVRTPWTLASDIVWERTHRLGGWLFVAVGLLGIPCSFIPALRPWGILILLLLVCSYLCVYSWWCYQRHTVDGREPLSEPFDKEDQE